MVSQYVILRPPLHPDFDLPKRKKLLKLKPGDLVKLRFKVGSDDPERMWVILEKCTDSELWSGKIDNDSEQKETLRVLPAGKIVHFHPLDIIAID